MHEVVNLAEAPKKKRKKLVFWYSDTVEAVYGDYASGIFAKKDGKEWGVTEYRSEGGAGHVIEKVLGGHKLPPLNYVVLDRFEPTLSARTGKPFRVYSKGFAPLAALPHWQKPFSRLVGSPQAPLQ